MKKTMALLTLTAALLAGCQDNYVPVGSRWHQLHQLQPQGETFAVTAGHHGVSRQYRIGESIRLSVTSERSGQLWVVAVDPKDQLDVIYPNHKDRDNRIRAGQPITLPAADARWDFAVDGPAGPLLLAYIVTTGETSVDDVLSALDGKEVDKAIRMVDRRFPWAIAREVIEVKER